MFLVMVESKTLVRVLIAIKRTRNMKDLRKNIADQACQRRELNIKGLLYSEKKCKKIEVAADFSLRGKITQAW